LHVLNTSGSDVTIVDVM